MASYTVEEPSAYSVEEPSRYFVEESPAASPASGTTFGQRYQSYRPKWDENILPEALTPVSDLFNVLGELAAPAQAAVVTGAEKLGIDLSKPSVGLEPLSVQDMLKPPTTTEEQLRNVSTIALPASGLGLMTRLGARGVSKLTPPPTAGLQGYKEPIGPPPPSAGLVEKIPGYTESELLTEPKGPGKGSFGPFEHQPVEMPAILPEQPSVISEQQLIPIRIERLRQRALQPSTQALDDGLPEAVKAKLPSGFSRMISDAISTLARTHPSGEKAGSLWMDVRDRAEQQALTGTQNFERAMDRIWGRRGAASPKQWNPIAHYETASTWRISKDEVDQIVDYLYSGGRIKPAGLDMAGSPLASPKAMQAQKIVETAEAYFASTKDASSHLGVREMPGVFDPATLMDTPFGEPNMFFSHLPMGKKAEGMQMRAYNEGWKQFHNKYSDRTRADFDDFMKKGRGSVRGYAGIERARIFDAEEGGRPSINLRKNGYDTDPRRVLFNYLNGTYGAGERKLAEPVWKAFENDILNNTTDLKTNAWVRTAFDRMRETDFDIADKIIGDTVSKINNVTNMMLLQYSTPMQANQLMYIIQRHGLPNFAESVISQSAAKLSNSSAAIFADYLTTLSIGAHDPFAKALQTVLTLNGFTGMDRLLRGLAGRSGDIEIRSLYNQLLKEPGNTGLRAKVKELGIDSDEILTDGLQTEHRLAAAKRFADETQGRRDLRGLPLWAADNAPYKRALLNLKNFMLINMSILKRDIIDAHSKGVPLKTVVSRAGQGTVAAGLMGELTKDILFSLTALESPFQDKRTPKAYRELFGAAFGRIVDDIQVGYSTLAFSLMFTMLQQDRTSILEAVAPPALSLGARAIEDPLKVGSRLIPFGPTIKQQLYPPKGDQSLSLGKE